MTIHHSPALRVLHQDASLCAVWKPAGLPVLPDATGDPDLRTMLQRQLGVTYLESPHRLDRPVSGVTLFALDPEALARLNEAFRWGAVKKVYWAIVTGRMEQHGDLVHRLVHDARNKRARQAPEGQGREVRSAVRPLGFGERYTLVEVLPEGGAFHQIRVQLSLAGFPIKGDVKYGARRGEPDRSIALHARFIGFAHPISGEGLCLEAPVPEGALWAALAGQVVAER